VRDDGQVSEPASDSTTQYAPGVAVAPKVRLLSLIAVAVLAVDVVTKTLAVALLEGRDPVELLGGAVYLVLVRNPGAAWSLATGYTWVLSLIAITIVVVIIRVARRLRSTGWAIALGLVLGGALGNLTDRIFRSPGPLRGHVVDMVSVFAPDGSAFPVFNAADSAVCCGGVLLVLLALTGRELDGTRTVSARRAAREEREAAESGQDEPADGVSGRSDGEKSGESSSPNRSDADGATPDPSSAAASSDGGSGA
jgi:signal peptidase II